MNRWLSLLALLAACTQPVAPKRTPAVATWFDAALYVVPDERRLVFARREEPLLVFDADGLELGTVTALDERQSYDPYWLEQDSPAFPKAVPEDLRWRKVTALKPGNLGTGKVALTFEGGVHATLDVTHDQTDGLKLVLKPSAPLEAPIAYVRLRARVSATEEFYGLGEVPDAPTHRGKLRPMQLEPDLELESASNEVHAPVPYLVGTRGWGLFVASDRFGLFDVARKEPDVVEVTYGTAEQSDEGLTFFLTAADHPLDVPGRYFSFHAKQLASPKAHHPKLPAPWALGPWIWRDENRDQAEVEEDVRTLRRLDLPTSGIWIDRPYASAVNTFDFDAARFPDPAKMVQTAHDAGLRVALWHTPYLEPDAQPYRANAESWHLFPPVPGALLNRWSAPLDFSNPTARDFWLDSLQRYAALGIDGYKLDYAEDVVAGLAGARSGWTFADGSTERSMQARYPVLYHQVYAGTLPESGGLLLCRAARPGDEHNGVVLWPGDLDATLTAVREPFVNRDGKRVVGVGGLHTAVVMGVSLGVSGFPFYGSDTGGYRHSPPDKETFTRWFEQSALSPVMQVGDSSSQPPWVFTPENGRDDATLALYRDYARLHLRLFPYLWSEARRFLDGGRPLMAPLGLAHPELGVHPSDVYLLGPSLYVAPVVRAGETSREVPLPAGRFFDWWTGAEIAGGATAVLAAPLERIPLLIREGAIVPLLRPTVDTLAPATGSDVDSFANTPGRLFVRMAPGAGLSRYTLYDGSKVQQLTALGRIEIALEAGEVFWSGWQLERVATREPAWVSLEGRSLDRFESEAAIGEADGWSWSGSGSAGTLVVRVGEGGARHLSVVFPP